VVVVAAAIVYVYIGRWYKGIVYRYRMVQRASLRRPVSQKGRIEYG